MQELEQDLALQRDLVRVWAGRGCGTCSVLRIGRWYQRALRCLNHQVSGLQRRLAASEARNHVLRQQLTDVEDELGRVRRQPEGMDGISASGDAAEAQVRWWLRLACCVWQLLVLIVVRCPCVSVRRCRC